MTYVAKASHLAKKLSKPVTITGTKGALRGYSVSIKEWVERKRRHVCPPLQLTLSHPFSLIFPSCPLQTMHAHLHRARSQ